MTSRTAAKRYAQALLDVVTKDGSVEKAADELDGFVAFLKQQAALDRVLMNPAVPAPRKRAAMAEIVKGAGLSPAVGKLLVLLAERDRFALLSDLAAAYRELLMDQQNVVRAEVTSASPLTADKTKAIETRLAAVTGKRVSMVSKVDKDILGGVVARVGGTVYDGSIRTQLSKIRERLTGQ
jgi:F-type H+-transporting ATPase subunit delta